MWAGFNGPAHSVLTQGSPAAPIWAYRWCTTPTIVGPNGVATTMSHIPIGEEIDLYTSGTSYVTGACFSLEPSQMPMTQEEVASQ